MKKTILLLTGLALFSIKNYAQTTVTDYDGNVYNTITIGSQIWLKENLKVTHFNNGDTIFTTSTPTLDITTESSPLYWWAYNGDENNISIYGRLYTWYVAIDNRNICPSGWHVPSYSEWTTFENYLIANGYNYNGSTTGNKIAKSIATQTYWEIDTATGSVGNNLLLNNSSDFSTVPNGARNSNFSYFTSLNLSGYFWSTTIYSSGSAWNFWIMNRYSYTSKDYSYKKNGFGIRCLKNSSTAIEELNFQDKYKIYPNPAINRITIDCKEKEPQLMQVYNMIGERLLQNELNNVTNDIDISSLPNGIYIIKLIGPNWSINRLLTKLQ